MSLADELRRSGLVKGGNPADNYPVWKGPEKDGITQSMLSKFVSCRERFRLLVVEGLRPRDGFNHRLEYGNMFHVCEEYTLQGQEWLGALETYCRDLCNRYPTDQTGIDHWYNVCKVQFPLYLRYWKSHPDVRDCKFLMQEEVFNIPYRLPSGRTVRLRGKWDSIDLIGTGLDTGVYVTDHKTKGDIDEELLKRQLGSGFHLQTMLYIVALRHYQKNLGLKDSAGSPIATPIKGIRLNVVRRPLSGGKHSIIRRKGNGNTLPEGKDAFYERLRSEIRSDPGYFFMRWKVHLDENDITRFQHQCLDPLLEQLCDWWEVVARWLGEVGSEDVDYNLYHSGLHWRTPYTGYNPLAEGRMGDLDGYLNDGNRIGLEEVDNLFSELE